MAIEKAPNVPPFVQYCAQLVPTVFDDSLSYYEALCALAKWMQDNLVNVVNNNADVTEAYIKKTDELQEYVANYFENLDVQEEIDNKLDEMVEAGTLQEIVASYLDSNVAWTFDTVSDMKSATNFENGSFAQTLGFHSVNDGGGALYQITNSGTADEMSIIAIGDGTLKAHLIASEGNPLQFGAYGDNTHNDTNAIQASADYARTNSLKFHMPAKTFLSDTVTITEVRQIEIEGIINLSSNTQALNIFESTQDYACNIYINRVNTGDIVMKGLNTADVRIQRAWKLDLVADATENHHWIAYCKFYLGFVNELNIYDDGTSSSSQYLYVNENLFEGGRFARVNIGTNGSSYHHENNLFMKPLCEGTTITLDYAKANIFLDARLEGTSVINFTAESFANIINQEWSTTEQGYYNPKDMLRSNITINDSSNGKNKVFSNNFVNEYTLRALSYYDNPNSITTNDYSLAPATTDPYLYQSDIVKLPDSGVFCISLSGDNAKLSKLIIRCYDSSKNLITSAPATSLIYNSPTLAWNNSYNGYTNGGYSNDYKWALIAPNNPTVKYIDVKIRAISGGTQQYYKHLDLKLTTYDNISPEIIQGLSKSVTLS